MKNSYEVTCGNIGTVHTGFCRVSAEKVFTEYSTLSDSGHGRAAYESVTLWKNGEPAKDHFPLTLPDD